MMKINPIVLFQDDSARAMPASQCDCACADINKLVLGEFKAINKSKNAYLKKNPDISYIAVDDKFTALIGPTSIFCVAENSVIDSLDIGYNYFDHFDTDLVNKLYSGGVLIDNDKEAANLNESVDSELSVWMHVTDKCNLRCEYCYLPHEKIDMELDDLNLILITITDTLEKYNYKKIKIKLAGGEPLLNWSFIVESVLLIRRNFSEDICEIIILTNATLLDEKKACFIKENKLKIMVSLDGLEHQHDKQRKYANGMGSFKKVEKALDIIEKFEIPVDISITVTGKTASGLADLVGYLLDRELFFGINFYRENTLSSSTINLKLEGHSIIEGILDSYKVIEGKLPNYNLLTSLADRANLSSAHEKTCKAGSDYLVFDPKGRVSQCQMQLDKTVTSFKAENPIIAIRTDPALINLSVNDKEICKTCSWKHWCAGGCPVETYRATGRYDINSPNCEIYKSIFPEVIKLEAKRLLKYGGIGIERSIPESK